jgi:hypothetical protein
LSLITTFLQTVLSYLAVSLQTWATPGDSLNKESIVEISSRYTSHKKDWEHTIELIRDGRTGVWAQYLSFLGLGGNFGASFDARTTDHHRIKDLETTYFSPTQAYVEEAVNKLGVRSYLKGSQYAPVYMITGVKIARGPGSEIISKRSYGREGHAHFGLSVAGSPLALDAGDMMLHQAGADNTSFSGSSDFVIGFQLAKISFHENAEGVRVPSNKCIRVEPCSASRRVRLEERAPPLSLRK